MSLLRAFIVFVVGLYRRCVAWLVNAPVYKLAHVAEEPPRLAARTVYAVGEKGHLWHVTFLCPCGCRAKIYLNLLPDDSPRWQLSTTGGLPSLVPSVKRMVGCRSHFILRNGRIVWCRR